MKNILIAIAITITSVQPMPAQACLGVAEEFTIFFDKIPVKLNDQTIAEVKIENMKRGVSTARIIRLIKTKNNVVKVGDRIILNYRVSSCTQVAHVGNIGTIVIKGFVNSDNERNLVAYPYQRRYRDGYLQ
ncbi:hypothetical protein [Chamaesiphon sp.]|uniref:hypothetical protein n=1 Tax=Chamaesiphon sp. TaxID=2814140 RepID=UPI003593D7E1